MLIYNPIFDLFHCTFRQLQILSHAKGEIPIEKLRLLDFYLAFPFEILKIRLPREWFKIRNYIKTQQNPYETLIDSKRLFLKMEPYQISAINFLSSLDIIDSNLLHEENTIKRTETAIPKTLMAQINLRNREDEQVLNIVTQILLNINLNGPDGLKARTNLMEHKYDIL